ncbi:ATP-dependent nuclease [Micromonospora parva]|uniref:ATP-dependent nuclease n=1 Tax=Micromonospora parva TaxID=1464048 RepID=UPI00379566EF
MLKRLILRSFKGFSDFTVSFNRDVNVLVGPNNAGKTTIIGAIRLCAALVEHARRWNPGDRTAKTFGRPQAYSITDASLAAAAFNTENVYHNFLEQDAAILLEFSNGAVMQVEWPASDDPSPEYGFFTVTAPSSIRFRAAQKARDFLPSIGVVPTLTPVEGRERVVTKRTVRINYTTRLASSHFRNQVWSVFRGPDDDWQNLQEFVLRFTPEISDLRIEGSYIGASDDSLDLYYRESASGREREVTWAGDGMQVWLQILFHLWRERGKECLVLDEPDVYLHPDLQRRLVALVRASGQQVILATHSVEALNELGHEAAIAINRELSGGTRFSGNGAMAEYAGIVGSGIQLGLARALTRRLVLFVEGQDLSILRILAAKIGAIRVANEQGLAVIALGGFSQWPSVAGFSKVLKQAGGGPLVNVLLDRDDRSNEVVTEITNQVSKDGARIHIWRQKEIENYLLKAETIARASGLDVSTVERMIEETARELRSSTLSRWMGRRYRDSPKKLDPGTVSANALKEFEEKWDGKRDYLAMVSGKSFLKLLNQKVVAVSGDSLNSHRLANEVRGEEIDDEVVTFLRGIERDLR